MNVRADLRSLARRVNCGCGASLFVSYLFVPITVDLSAFAMKFPEIRGEYEYPS